MLDSIDGKEWLIRVESQSHTVILPNQSSHDLLKKHAPVFCMFGKKKAPEPDNVQILSSALYMWMIF